MRRLGRVGQNPLENLDPTTLLVAGGVLLAGAFLMWGGKKTHRAYRAHRGRRIRRKIQKLQAQL